MQPIDCPSDVIGEDSAAGSLNALSNAHQKLNLIYNQLKTTASFSKYDKSPLNCEFHKSYVLLKIIYFLYKCSIIVFYLTLCFI